MKKWAFYFLRGAVRVALFLSILACPAAVFALMQEQWFVALALGAPVVVAIVLLVGSDGPKDKWL